MEFCTVVPHVDEALDSSGTYRNGLWWFGYSGSMVSFHWEDTDLLGSLRYHHTGTTHVALVKAETLFNSPDFVNAITEKDRSDKLVMAQHAKVWLSALLPKGLQKLKMKKG